MSYAWDYNHSRGKVRRGHWDVRSCTNLRNGFLINSIKESIIFLPKESVIISVRPTKFQEQNQFLYSKTCVGFECISLYKMWLCILESIFWMPNQIAGSPVNLFLETIYIKVDS